MRSVLERAGFTVLEAGNYYDGLKIASEREFLDVLIADVSLPGPNGCELARRVMDIRPDVTVLFISGYTGAEVCRHYGIQLHDLHFMAKPLDAQALAARVRWLLDSKAQDAGELPAWSMQPEGRDYRR